MRQSLEGCNPQLPPLLAGSSEEEREAEPGRQAGEAGRHPGGRAGRQVRLAGTRACGRAGDQAGGT